MALVFWAAFLKQLATQGYNNRQCKGFGNARGSGVPLMIFDVMVYICSQIIGCPPISHLARPSFGHISRSMGVGGVTIVNRKHHARPRSSYIIQLLTASICIVVLSADKIGTLST
ncbi:hypothetical protein GGR58DRAFT_126198 [Xylaria digitata]|nr:hypothetical protein GGR58DRAFT_126198 [Xylaria digitata]